MNFGLGLGFNLGFGYDMVKVEARFARLYLDHIKAKAKIKTKAKAKIHHMKFCNNWNIFWKFLKFQAKADYIRIIWHRSIPQNLALKLAKYKAVFLEIVFRKTPTHEIVHRLRVGCSTTETVRTYVCTK